MKMNDPKKVNDVFPGWLNGGGIFAALQSLAVPWQSKNIAASLDVEYHGNVSGDKIVSPLINRITSGETLTEEEKTVIAESLFAVNGENWAKQWATLSAEYNPIENYSMREQMTDDKTVTDYGKTHTRTNNLSHIKTGTEKDVPDLTQTQTPDLNTATDNTVFGFNSAAAVPVGGQTQKATGTSTTAQTGSETREYNTTDADTGTQTDTDTGADTQTRNYTLTRAGNIGVTTSQQMLESERALWVWNYFRKVVFPDVDRVLTIRIY